ncbi:beta-galactosidase [Enterococcus thailandicus]|uniref:beta-galactosidase n=1 Tax=Enterococcus thailandicus TaxID=417368 RepID=UPI0022E203A9|nr:beta-galactosidase [Enterococcus thailandicus]
MKKIKRIFYGGDYNPEQWEKKIWLEDMEIFKSAKINSATINVFSWAKIQPSKDVYDFEQLDEIMNQLAKENIEIVLGTSTAALPAWLYKEYPEVGRVDFEGRRHRFGQRHNACPNSLVYQHFSTRLAGKLAERYSDVPQLAVWHINNEYGGICYCENCEKAFRIWLKKKYQTIEALNTAWNLNFWGHTVYDWDEIVVPNCLGDAMNEEETAFAGLSVDYMRFNSDSLLANFKAEREAIRQFDQETPVTTNLMGTYKGLDYFKWAKEMDLVSWDNYPAYNTPWSSVALGHDLMRGLKDQSFMLMEQTPSQQNWQPYNSLKKPGELRAQSYQAIAHGADTIQYFQLRRSIGGCEKFHGAVIEHAGTTNTRVFREVAELGNELESLGDLLVEATCPAKVAILFDWDNYWALEYTSGPNQNLKYVEQIQQVYAYFYQQNIPVDLIPIDRDISKYELILAPVLYMIKGEIVSRLEDFVRAGGTFVTTFMSGIVDQSDNVLLGGYPGPLRKLTGIWVEELDALAPEQSNQIQFADGETGTATLVSDLLHLETAESLGSYTDNFYAGQPFATKCSFGKGQTYYLGTQLDTNSLAKVLNEACASAKVESVVAEETALEITYREKGRQKFYFIINLSDQSQKLPTKFIGQKDLLKQTSLVAEYLVKAYEVLIVKESQ